MTSSIPHTIESHQQNKCLYLKGTVFAALIKTDSAPLRWSCVLISSVLRQICLSYHEQTIIYLHRIFLIEDLVSQGQNR